MKPISIFSILALSVSVSSAAILAPVTGYKNTSSDPTPSFILNHGYTPSSTDLLTGLIPVTIGNFTTEGGRLAALNDGAFIPIDRNGFLVADPLQTGNFAVAGLGGTLAEQAGQFATFTFGSAVNITTIDVYSGWQDNGRDGQKFNIRVLYAGSSVFQLLTVDGPITYEAPGAPFINDQPTPSASKVTVLDSTGTLASNVTAIQFEFLGAEDTNLRYTGYAEIDVFGVAVPEPSTAALLGFGLLGALRRRR